MALFELGLLAVVGAGWLLGGWLNRRYRGRASAAAGAGEPDAGSAGAGEPDAAAAAPGEPDAGSERLTDTIGFVGGAYGILLGLLVVFAVGHFVDTRQVTKDEAATAGALFAAVDPYPAAQRDPLRHDLLCSMSAVADDDWEAARAGDLTGSENASAYARRVQQRIQDLPQDTDAEASNHYFATEENLDLAKYRQLRLLDAIPEIPAVIWGVIYLSALLFIVLVVFHLGRRRWVARLAVVTTTLMLMVIVGALIQLDAPYLGIGTSLRPVAMDAALERLRDAYPEPASLWAPCPRLAAEEAG